MIYYNKTIFVYKTFNMKITIIGGGNMGSAIAYGLASVKNETDYEIYVINRRQEKSDEIKSTNNKINVLTNEYDIISSSDIVIIAVKPWLMEEVLSAHKDKFNSSQLVVSIAGGISLDQLSQWLHPKTPIFRVIPNTAIAISQSMTFISSINASPEQQKIVLNMFNKLGKAEIIKEDLIAAATSLSSCGIAFAFRYIRAAMEGGVEMGLYPNQSKDILIQTLRGAIELLENNQSHPEAEIDKVTTAGGITIKGLNEMENAGFTSAVIRGLKASYVK